MNIFSLCFDKTNSSGFKTCLKNTFKEMKAKQKKIAETGESTGLLFISAPTQFECLNIKLGNKLLCTKSV